MNLTDEQKNAIAGWVKKGLGLSDIQRKLREELSITMTFMETRFLVDDLNLDLVEKAPPPPPLEDATPLDETDALAGADTPPPLGGVSVELDRITQPGTVVSGSVVFSDGKSSTWALDQAGRLMLAALQEGYQPSPKDLEVFQKELSAQLEKQGY